ncbi:YfbM family protein [Lacibacter sp.]|uniref:YfbM family protein n=1 Tax=Lacibacter sp. TaxID=1915409 RepID=UPI002B4B8F29|nr:YfbM family protein [Lacibacter sp.]HLP39511.1 YfbM family protein [Lacibacter sp.]
MSMIANLLRVTRAELEDYLNDSSLLESRIYNDETDEEDPNLVDIDQSWDGIVFLLTGHSFENNTDPLAKVLFSDQVIDEEQDLGYGPGQYVTAEQVKELHEQIATISTDELKKRFDAGKMKEAGVFPDVWDNPDTVDYLIEYFETIKEVYALATKNDEAIITFIN